MCVCIYIEGEREIALMKSIGDFVGFGGSLFCGGFLDNELFISGYLFYFDLAIFFV